MISRYTYKNLTWVDLESPSREEIIHIGEEFQLPQLAAEEMINSTLRSKVDLYNDFIYVILHFPIILHQTGKSNEQEIDFVIGKNFVITTRYEHIDPLHEFSKKIEGLSFDHHTPMHGGTFFMLMMKELYHRSLHELDGLTHVIKTIEGSIFENQERKVVKSILATNRKLLDFKQALRFHQDVLHSYEVAGKKFFGEEYSFYAGIITSEFNKVNSSLLSLSDTLSELQRTNDSLLSSRSNDIMRTFTIMTFVMLPLNIITGIFGMNTVSNMIFIQNYRDFFFIVGAMTLSAIVMSLFFRHRRWL